MIYGESEQGKMNEMDKYVEHVMEMIASGGIDKEKLKNKLISNWSKLEIKAERLTKEMNEILKEAGATETQIEWGIDLPTLSWKEEKRMCQLETELKDVLVEMAAVKGAEEALKRMENKITVSRYRKWLHIKLSSNSSRDKSPA